MDSIAFEIPGAEGQHIRGDVHAPGAGGRGRAPVVVILHGFKGFKDWGFFHHLAWSLAQAGFHAVRFNFSHNGVDESEAEFPRLDLFRRNTWTKELFDAAEVERAVGEGRLPCAAKMDPSRLFLLGHSKGGAVALLRAWRGAPAAGGTIPGGNAVRGPGAAGRCAGVVTWNSIPATDMLFARLGEEGVARWRERGFIEIPNERTGQRMPLDYAYVEDMLANRAALSVAAALAALPCPALFVAGSRDEGVPPEASRFMARASGGKGRLAVIEGGDHVFGARHPWAGTNPVLEEAIAVTVAALREWA
ncbi:MAG: alpha/beta fold hydrolase [Planctomycetes bacterium]|nr:alpha/beta fold hydrolase [Planctomycetota bacterium]